MRCPSIPGTCLSVVSIVSLELAHNENKFCLIFACVPHFFHSYNLDIWSGRSYPMLCTYCLQPMRFFPSLPGVRIHVPILYMGRLSLVMVTLPDIKFVGD